VGVPSVQDGPIPNEQSWQVRWSQTLNSGGEFLDNLTLRQSTIHMAYGKRIHIYFANDVDFTPIDSYVELSIGRPVCRGGRIRRRGNESKSFLRQSAIPKVLLPFRVIES